jgi:hypothetical protein
VTKIAKHGKYCLRHVLPLRVVDLLLMRPFTLV